MSQWNNTYNYNGQQQATNSWDGDVNRQYMNQAYYTNGQYDANNQYVSFNDFISQMQIPNLPATNTTNYSNVQYQNYPNGQYPNMTNYQSGPSQPSSRLVYGYQTNTANFSNNLEVYQDNMQSQYARHNVPDQNGYSNVVSKSRLTPTASEFIPKSAIKSTDDSLANDNTPEPQPSQPSSAKEASNRNQRPSSSTNWRERPQNSNQNGDTLSESSQTQKNGKAQKPSEYKSKQEESGTYSHNTNIRKESANNYNDYNNRNNKNKKSYDNTSTCKSSYRNEYTNQKSNNNFRNKNKNIAESKNNIDISNENTDSEYGNNSSTSKNKQTQDSNYDSSYNTENNSQKSSNTFWNKNRNNQDNHYEGGYEGNTDNEYKNDPNPSKHKQTTNSDSGSEASYPNEYNSQRASNNFKSKNRCNQGSDNYNSRYNDDVDTEHTNSPETSNNRHTENPSYDSSYRHKYTNQNYSNNFRNKNRNNQEYNSRNSSAAHYNDDVDNEYEYNNQKSNRYKQDSETGRTYYNNSRPKSTQDVRARNDNSRGRNWAGSQRVRTDYTKVEDEEFANSYISYREDKDNKSPKGKGKGKSSMAITDGKELTQRERLSEQLDKGTLECLVCCERVKQMDPVWYCGNCYHVLHLRCIRKWAVSSMVESKWRCPACQNVSQDIPTEYRCMCGALRNPEHQRGASGAHTCGKSCKRTRTCPHPCTLLCHPGPCPPCQATISKQCGCGAETRTVLCSSKLPQMCGRECQRQLECNVHTCGKECHDGLCEACKETVTQVCYCPAGVSRTIPCTAESGACAQWSCGAECGLVLACGAHVCRTACHPPPCPPCPLRPDNVPTCPCGNTRLSASQRKTCSDPIPLCDNICAKPLPCGPPGDKHFCKEKCHEGPCRVCPDKTVLQCRCGHSSREVLCADLPEANVLCQRKCNKKLSCGRHRCRMVCCDAATHRCTLACGRSLACQSHRCTLVCGRSLACQLHRCEEFCHTGHCEPCPVVSFEELTCACGAEAVLPPVRCGTRAPVCSAPCRKARACGHPPHHICHSGDCPPCVVLTTKSCHGRHEERKTIPCSQEEFSCGMPCGKPLPCGKHTCIKTCHKGPCDAGKCTQACREKRRGCDHECAAPCHAGAGGACPSGAPCRRPVRATCACGRRAMDRACADNARDYAKLMSTLAASKMQEGGSVDLSDVQRPGNMLKTLECDEECYVEARSRRMALALQIRNPDVSSKLAPRYGDALRTTAARDPAFAQHVHDKLTDLVQLAKKSKQKTRAHSFPSMNRQKRQFIHEMCKHFGCESVAYDAEPNRNVVATADREKSWLPAMSVLEVLAREAGKRRVPGPVLRAPPASVALAPQASPAQPAKSTGGWATLISSNAWAARSQPKQEKKIDYFDNPPN